MPKYANTTERSLARDKRIARAIRGLLRIARIAMPDTYYTTDRRVGYAQRILRDTLHKPGVGRAPVDELHGLGAHGTADNQNHSGCLPKSENDLTHYMSAVTRLRKWLNRIASASGDPAYYRALAFMALENFDPDAFEPVICAHLFDRMLCVGIAGHEGPHITSNARFPKGLAA